MAQAKVRLEGIQAVVFDAYGTLFDVASPVAKMAADLDGKGEDLARGWRQTQLNYTWLRSLMGVHDDFWNVTRAALDHTLAALDLTEAGLADELMALYLKLDAFPDALDALKAIKARSRRTAILSNGSPSMLDQAVRHAGLEKLLDQVLSVEDVGIYKPSRRVYRHAMQKLQIHDAPSICFVSGNGWDAQGAAHFGFQAVRLARQGEADDNLPGKPVARITSLSELPTLF